MLVPKKQLSIGIVFCNLCTKAKKEQYNISHVTQHRKVGSSTFMDKINA
jgi:hypothetical protein